jgi:general secretion pathway protein L
LSTLYIRHPSKASVDSAQAALPCPFALVSSSGAIERQGALALAQMASLIDGAQKIVVLLAASDVSLFRIKIPPLSATRLRAALPSLVEEQLVNDPAECVMVASNQAPNEDGMRNVAVMDRGWLELLVKTLQGFGARKISALPAQLCLPTHEGRISAAISDITDAPEANIDLTLRFDAEHGIGLPVLPDYGNINANVIETLRAMVPEADIHLSVPTGQITQFEGLAAPGIHIEADNWSHWIAGTHHPLPDLLQGLAAGGAASFNWARWRWPFILLGLIILLNALILNIEWLRSKREADTLRRSMIQSFQSAFPKEPLSPNLSMQLKQKIAAAKVASGEASVHDFITLTAAFGDAWASVSQGRKVAGIGGLEYKEKALQVRLKKDGEMPFKEMEQALAARNINLKQAAPDIWEMRSTQP